MKKVIINKLETAIDIGTTKICVLIGHKDVDGKVNILGIGKVPSEGLKKGVVVDIAKTVRSIRNAVKEAELMADLQIDSAVVGISGAHIQSKNAYGAVPLEKGEVRHEDMEKVIAAAKAVPLSEGQQILHVLPQFYSIDGQDRLQDPLGMHGIRLEAQVHIISGAISAVQNLVKCCEMAGVRVQDIVLEHLASAYAVLNDDERELGVGVLDIGGGTADLAIYQNGSIRHTFVVPVAGNHFTNDLAIGLRTTLKDAERIKREYGLASADLLENDKEVEVELVQGEETRMIHMHDIVDILEPRTQELLSIVHEEILARNLGSVVTSGLVITGGGSLLKGIEHVAHEILQIPVRLGTPHITSNEPEMLANPMHATGFGLLLYAMKKENTSGVNSHEQNGVTGLLIRMKSWVSDFF